MVILLKVVLIIAAILMTFLILLQEGKGGGLAALGGTKAASVEGVTNPIRRATAYLAAIWFALAIILGFMAKGSGGLLGDKNRMYDTEIPGLKSGENEQDKKTKALGAGAASPKATESKTQVVDSEIESTPASSDKQKDGAAGAKPTDENAKADPAANGGQEAEGETKVKDEKEAGKPAGAAEGDATKKDNSEKAEKPE